MERGRLIPQTYSTLTTYASKSPAATTIKVLQARIQKPYVTYVRMSRFTVILKSMAGETTTKGRNLRLPTSSER